MTIFDELSKIGIVPVIAIDSDNDAPLLAKALIDGGLPCAEITFRTAAAGESIRKTAQRFPQMLVGAGTVLTTTQVDEAVDAGAKFIVSPGLNPKIVSYCLEKNVPILPGCSNPSDIEVALELGLEYVKFFPAEASGGLKMIQAMSAPYTKVKFMPTGGVTADNLVDYLRFPKIIACGGSWMVSKELISAKAFEEITKLTKNAVDKMLGFSIAHIGINDGEPQKAVDTANAFENLFGFAKKEGEISVFAGTLIEAMKIPYYGENGHIGIATNFVDRAIYHLEKRGAKWIEETRKLDDKGNTAFIYMKDTIGGFAIHLIQK